MTARGYTIACLVGATLAPALAGCEDTETALQRGAPPAIVLSQVRLETYGPAGSTGVTTAREVTYRRDTGALSGDTVVTDLPPSESVGRGGVVLSAPRASGDMKKKVATAEGGVAAITGNGDAGHTAEAHYDGAAGTVSANTPVHVDGPGYSLDAGGYTFVVAESRLELQGGVIARSTPAGTAAAPAGAAARAPAAQAPAAAAGGTR
jgi:hypothetical protein